MRYPFFVICLFLGQAFLSAQTTVGLVAYYPFDTSLVDVTGNSANTGFPSGQPAFTCGVKRDGLAFDGFDDEVAFLGPVNGEFDTEDFTLSFYFKPTGVGGIQYLLSKRRMDCAGENAFYIRYVPATRTINCLLAESAEKGVTFTARLPDGDCWHQVTLVRRGIKVRLYINGELHRELGTSSRIDIDNNGQLLLGTTDCLGPNEFPFNGIIDDLRVYNLALEEDEVEELYSGPDRIQTPDTTVFLGASIRIRMAENCPYDYSWTPTTNLSDPGAPRPLVTPTQAGEYYYRVRVNDGISSCIATDSVLINVVDPSQLDCETVYFPKAFTPNGDGLNDEYGLSNPYAVQTDFISWEIFDRWGNRVFYAEDPFARWDGSLNGQPLNPGVLLWRARYRCSGEEKLASGSLTILR